MRPLLGLVALVVLAGCGSRMNPGAPFPLFRISQDCLDARWPQFKGASGVYTGSAIYVVRTEALPHEVAHLADDLGCDYWKALALLDAPDFRCGPHTR